jgi:hypothetical protein
MKQLLLLIGLAAVHTAPIGLRTGFSARLEEVVLAIPIDQPLTLSWVNDLQSRGDVQTMFQVEVVTTNKSLPVWSSGKQNSTDQAVVVNEAVRRADTDFQWRVQTVVGTGAATWSNWLSFSTAPSSESWVKNGATWIGGHNQLRSDFTLSTTEKPLRARVHVTGVGAFYLSLNGQRLGDHIMDPPQTVYPYRVMYSTFDVLPLLKPGPNVLGAILGNYKWGYTDIWCNMTSAGGPNGCRALQLQLVVQMADGTELVHTTNTQEGVWQCRQGPIVWDHLFHGETYDARLDIDGWDSLPFEELVHGSTTSGAPPDWKPVQDRSHIPGGDTGNKSAVGPLVPMQMPPLRIGESFAALSVNLAVPSGGGGGGGRSQQCFPQGKLAAIVDECREGASHDPPTCGDGDHGDSWGVTTLRFRCAPGTGKISSIDFAVYGTPSGDCEHGFQAGDCHADVTKVIETACLGKTECAINATASILTGGKDPCYGKSKQLAVMATGCTPVDPDPNPPTPAPTPTPGTIDRWVFDFGQNVVGFATLKLEDSHDLPVGARIQIEYSELLHAYYTTTTAATSVGEVGVSGNTAIGKSGDINNQYCATSGAAGHDLRHEPCAPHQTFDPTAGTGHETPDRYIGDFNCANQTNVYVVKSTGVAAVYTPHFATAGFRFATLSVHPPLPALGAHDNSAGSSFSWKPTLTTLTSKFVHTDVESVGTLKLPHVAAEGQGSVGTPDVLNKIHRAVRYSQLSNLFSVPTDCPQRERRGWLGDAQVTSQEAMLNFDMQGFYLKFFRDIRHDQLWGCHFKSCGMPANRSAGSLPEVVPYDGIGGWPGCPVWQVAYIVIMRNYWRFYGDAAPVVEHWPGLVALMGYFERRVDPKDGLLLDAGYGDWFCVGPDPGCPRTPSTSVTAFYYVLGLGYLAELAPVAGRPAAEAQQWGIKHNHAVRAWHSRFYNATARGYSPVNTTSRGAAYVEPRGSQTSNAMGLALGADSAVQDVTKAVVDALVENMAANKNHLTFGIVGSAWLFPSLADKGQRGDLALAMLLTDDFPSLGRMVGSQKMTTLCESWSCTETGGPGSKNHIMYGGFDSWMTSGLGGLRPISNASSTGWRNFVVRPDKFAIMKLQSGSYSIRTRFGTAALAWVYDVPTKEARFNVTVPVGSEATVVHEGGLPSKDGDAAASCALELEVVRESGAALWASSISAVSAAVPMPKGVLHVNQYAHGVEVTVGSGEYVLTASYHCTGNSDTGL